MCEVFKLIGIVAVLCIPPVTGIQFSMSRNQVELGNPSEPVLTLTCTTDVSDALIIRIQRENTARTGWQPLATLVPTGSSIMSGLPSYWSSANVTGDFNIANSLSLAVQASSLTCEDERTYQCEVTILDTSSQTATEVQNSTLQITAMPSTPTLSAKDLNTHMPINFGFSENSPAEMNVGDQVELTCGANIGSDSSRSIRWQKSSEVNPGQMIDYTGMDGDPVKNTGTANGCTYTRTSKITYNTTVIDSNRADNMGLRFSCFFLVNQQETQQMFYIDVAGESGVTSIPPDGTESKNPPLVAAVVICVVVVCVVIAAVTVFCARRYRARKEGPTRNQEQTNSPGDDVSYYNTRTNPMVQLPSDGTVAEATLGDVGYYNTRTNPSVQLPSDGTVAEETIGDGALSNEYEALKDQTRDTSTYSSLQPVSSNPRNVDTSNVNPTYQNLKLRVI